MDSELVFLTGQNAQGKTSLLEAVAVASRLGSPRASKQSQIMREGVSGCGVAIQLNGQLLKAIYEDRKFELAVDGQTVTRKEYLSVSPKIVWMENRDLELIRGSGEKRRRFLDAIGSQTSAEYASCLRAYTKALRSRNALLKAGRSSEGSFHAFTDLLIKNGKFLIETRTRILEHLLPHVIKAQAEISGHQEIFQMEYAPSSTSLEEDVLANLSKDVVMKQTLIGPHRDDFSLLVDGRLASDYASEGQQRTLALALRLAQGQLLLKASSAEKIIYLIDDIFGELDMERRQSLLSALPSKSQKLLTTTSLNWGNVNGQVFHLSGGKVRLEKS